MLTPDSVIDALGGTTAVASALSLKKSAVSCWRSRGIPSRHWTSLSRRASELGISDITVEALAELKPVEEARA